MAQIRLELPDRELAAIDQARGEMKRLTWIRWMLRQAAAEFEFPEPVVRTGPAVRTKVLGVEAIVARVDAEVEAERRENDAARA